MHTIGYHSNSWASCISWHMFQSKSLKNVKYGPEILQFGQAKGQSRSTTPSTWQGQNSCQLVKQKGTQLWRLQDTVSHKNGQLYFGAKLLCFLVDFYTSCTKGNMNEYSNEYSTLQRRYKIDNFTLTVSTLPDKTKTAQNSTFWSQSLGLQYSTTRMSLCAITELFFYKLYSKQAGRRLVRSLTNSKRHLCFHVYMHW